jgi:ADP-dependent NAD(P)H-hydrate dehydratase
MNPDHPVPDHTVVTPALLRDWTHEPTPRHTALVIGGAAAAPGAVVLAGTAALRAGAGTLQLGTAARHASAAGLSVPESMVIALPETEDGAISRESDQVLGDHLSAARSVVIGPGLTDVEETMALMARLLPRVHEDARVVLDAYALGALSRDPALADPVADRLVLTPNTTEAAYLLGCDEDDLPETAVAACRIAKRYRAVVTLMGCTADPDGRTWLDGSGHIGLATSGSGDVLAGLVGGFLARSGGRVQATCWAAHVHAVAGQRLIPARGRVGLLARELLDEVPIVIAELSG